MGKEICHTKISGLYTQLNRCLNICRHVHANARKKYTKKRKNHSMDGGAIELLSKKEILILGG